METEEITKLIEQTSQGYWIPISIVSGIFGLVILLLLHIWKNAQSDNKERHLNTEKLLAQTVNTQNEMGVVIKKLEVITEYHEKAINRLSE